MEAGFKIMFTIGDFYIYESLSNHTSFRPILFGATVPLKVSESPLTQGRHLVQ
jgi:hypothetical protein